MMKTRKLWTRMLALGLIVILLAADWTLILSPQTTSLITAQQLYTRTVYLPNVMKGYSPSGVITGQVVDATSGDPIGGASVSIPALSLTVATNARGRFAFHSIPAGDYTVVAQKYGFLLNVRLIELGTGAILDVDDICITPLADPVSVGPSGGEIQAADGTVVEIPPGALETEVEISVVSVEPKALPILSSSSLCLSPEASHFIPGAVHLAPDDLTYAEPITVTFALPDPMPAGTELPVLHFDAETLDWQLSAIAVVSADGTSASFQTTHHSVFAIISKILGTLATACILGGHWECKGTTPDQYGWGCDLVGRHYFFPTQVCIYSRCIEESNSVLYEYRRCEPGGDGGCTEEVVQEKPGEDCDELNKCDWMFPRHLIHIYTCVDSGEGFAYCWSHVENCRFINPRKPYCFDGSCVECLENAHCTDPPKGTILCTEGMECNCKDGVCRSNHTCFYPDRQCPPEQPHCIEEEHKCSTNGTGSLVPMAVAENATAVPLELEGGSLNFAEGTIVLDFPSGAVPVPTMIVYTPQSTMPVAGFQPIRFFTLEAYTAGCQWQKVTGFNKPVTIQVSYSPEEVAGIDESALGLYYFDNELNEWVALEAVVDPAGDSVTVNELNYFTLHFTLYALMAPAEAVVD